MDFDVYLVGGAVRDSMLGLEPGDRDWVVVGATTEQMLELGFTQVGRDFPVFLHPQTHEEYALARTERAQGRGHTGFVVHADPTVTLEQDLARRDLTINAMALKTSQKGPETVANNDGSLVDPFNGAQDLAAGILRHVSPAFVEDPLRVLRVARFAARLPEFTLAEETQALLEEMCANNMLADLSAERVWQELAGALNAVRPERFFQVLKSCGGLSPWLVELEDSLLDLGLGSSMSRFARLPLGVSETEQLCERLKAPLKFKQSLLDRIAFASIIERWQSVPAEDLVQALTKLAAHHRPERLAQLLATLEISPHALDALVDAFRSAEVGPEVKPGPAYGAALSAARVQAIDRFRDT